MLPYVTFILCHRLIEIMRVKGKRTNYKVKIELNKIKQDTSYVQWKCFFQKKKNVEVKNFNSIYL